MPGDTVFCHYSGHGGRVVDTSEDEDDDGYDETLIPVHPVDDFRYFTALHMSYGEGKQYCSCSRDKWRWIQAFFFRCNGTR